MPVPEPQTSDTHAIKEAAERWLHRDFAPTPHALLERAFSPVSDELVLLAGGERLCGQCDGPVEQLKPCGKCEECKDEIRCRELPEEEENGDLPDYHCESCDRNMTAGETNWSGPRYGSWPAAWGTLWRPMDSSDEQWFRANAEEIADECGLLIYENDEVGLFLGIDGGGYDFYEQHWIPLYKLRGFKWHERDAIERLEGYESRLLYKTTVVIWSEYDPSKVELAELAADATVGGVHAISVKQTHTKIEDPLADEDFGAEVGDFFHMKPKENEDDDDGRD